MSFQTRGHCSKHHHHYWYRPLTQVEHSSRFFETVEDGIYVATPHEIIFRGSKIAKFNGEIRVLKESGGILVAGDDKGSVKVIKEKVLRRYEICSAVIDTEFIEALKVAVICEDGFLRVYEFQVESPIATIEFGEKLYRVAYGHKMLAVLTEHRMVFLDSERFIEIKAFCETGDGLCFLNDRKVVLHSRNKMRIIDIEIGDVTEKRVHRCAINKIEVRDGIIYSLGGDGYIKAVDDGLNILDCYIAYGVSYFIAKDNGIHVLKNNSEILIIEKQTGNNADDASYRMLEVMMKRYEYRGSLMFALERGDMRMLCCVLQYLFDVNGIKQALSNYTLDSLISILLFVIESWHWVGYTKIDAEVVHMILNDYVQFYTELKPYLNDLAKNVTDDLLFQQERCIVASFAEEILHTRQLT